jgi:hypothetical protein
LRVTVLLEALQMSFAFHCAVKLCPMLPDLMVLFPMFCSFCLSLQTSRLLLTICRSS